MIWVAKGEKLWVKSNGNDLSFACLFLELTEHFASICNRRRNPQTRQWDKANEYLASFCLNQASGLNHPSHNSTYPSSRGQFFHSWFPLPESHFWPLFHHANIFWSASLQHAYRKNTLTYWRVCTLAYELPPRLAPWEQKHSRQIRHSVPSTEHGAGMGHDGVGGRTFICRVNYPPPRRWWAWSIVAVSSSCTDHIIMSQQL